MLSDSQSEPKQLPKFEEVLSEIRRMPNYMWVNLARHDQSRRWRLGLGKLAEDYVAGLPELSRQSEDLLVLICGEVQLRTECGERPSVTEYQQRFPELADELALQFEINQVLDGVAVDWSFDDPELKIPDLPGYQIEEVVGRGASSVVYRATQRSPQRSVAIKTLVWNPLDTGQADRHRREASILAKIQHPGVIRIYEAIESAGHLHLVMEYIDGPTLSEFAGGRLLPARDASSLVLSLAEAMEVVHGVGILHRDLKPSNVLMTNAVTPIVTDFGLAKWLNEANSESTENSLLGTPSYMAPEQVICGSEKPTPLADVYSLGAILYELLTGRPPFVGTTLIETLTSIRERQVIPPRKLVPSVPKDLQTICLKCLEKTPGQRYGGANQLAEDIRRYLAGKTILARPARPHEVTLHWVRRNPTQVIAIMVVVMLLGIIVVGTRASAMQRRLQSREAATESIANADLQSLPLLIQRLKSDSDSAQVLSEARRRQAPKHSKSWRNFCIVEAALGDYRNRYELLGYLEVADANEIELLVDAIAAGRTDVPDSVWQQLADGRRTDEQRLRIACFVAKLAGDHERWQESAPSVARILVQQNPVDVGLFANAIRPAATAIVKVLPSLARDENLDRGARLTAVGLMADYAADRPTELANLIVDLDVEQFNVLLPALRPHADAALPILLEIVSEGVEFKQFAAEYSPSDVAGVERAFDVFQQRRATALIAAWHLGRRDEALASLAYGRDTSLRAWLIELLLPLAATWDEVMREANLHRDDGIGQALILAIGHLKKDSLSATEFEVVIDRIRETEKMTHDCGVHSACQWLLQINAAQSVFLTPLDEDSFRNESFMWWHGPNDHTFALIERPGRVTVGSPTDELHREEDEVQREVLIEYDFAIATKEVTVAQFRKFSDNEVNRRYSPTADCPANNTTFFQAMAYCRWLSELDGLAEAEMCYPPVERIGPGMNIPADWASRVGYRLPTEFEWEYACRGGESGSRYFGEGRQLLSSYAWTVHNSDDRAWPVGSLKPNRFGLFDSLGNIGELCSHNRADSGGLVINGSLSVPRRGGDFGDTRGNVRAARHHALPAVSQWGNTGFRVARTIRRTTE